jgi:hypothetical protein
MIDKIICPYCEKEQEYEAYCDVLLYGEQEEPFACDKCEKEF